MPNPVISQENFVQLYTHPVNSPEPIAVLDADRLQTIVDSIKLHGWVVVKELSPPPRWKNRDPSDRAMFRRYEGPDINLCIALGYLATALSRTKRGTDELEQVPGIALIRPEGDIK